MREVMSKRERGREKLFYLKNREVKRKRKIKKTGQRDIIKENKLERKRGKW